MADCQAKNQDKEDPAAYCASIKQKAEGDGPTKTEETLNLYDAQKNLTTMVAGEAMRGFKRAIQHAEAINLLTESVATLTKHATDLTKRIHHTTTALKTEAKLRHAYDMSTAKTIFKELATIRDDARNLREYLEATFTTLATNLAETKQLTGQQKRDFEQILSVADKNAVDMQKTIKSLEEWKAAQEQEDAESPADTHACPDGEHWDDAEKKCVPNGPSTEEVLQSKLKEMETKLENLTDKLKPQFQGSQHQQDRQPTKDAAFIPDPTRKGRK